MPATQPAKTENDGVVSGRVMDEDEIVGMRIRAVLGISPLRSAGARSADAHKAEPDADGGRFSTCRTCDQGLYWSAANKLWLHR